jgi:HEAT repeat protein
MDTNEARKIATEKLISIYRMSSAGSDKRKVAIKALGRVGGEIAAKELVKIIDSSRAGSDDLLTAIEALGEVGRVL